MSPRKYDASGRRAAAGETRRRVVEAARALLGGKADLSEFSMDAVADRAGVARMTVYNQFHSRAGLLEAVSDQLAAGGGMARMPQAFREPDPDRALRILVETFVGFWASDRVTLRRIRALGVAFPSDAAGPCQRDAWRREALAHLLAKASAAGPSATGDTIDLVGALTSFETFDALCVGRRKPADVARLLGELAVAVVRDGAERRPGRARSGPKGRSGAVGSGTPGSP